MSFSKFLDPKNYLAFMRVFGSERNKDIIIHFLNDIFAGQISPVKQIRFLKTIQEPEVASQRVSIVDIMCEAVDGDRFIVEMQVLHEPGFEKRAQFYAARAYIDQRQTGVEYKDLKQVIFLAITDFIVFPNKPNYLSHHYVLDAKTYERDLKDFSFSFLELPKFKKEIDELDTMIEKWTYFFQNAQRTTERELEDIAGDDLIIKRAYEELNRFSWTQGELLNYDSVDMKMCADRAILHGARTMGREEGRLEGKLEAKIEMARALLQKKYKIETVAEITSLSVRQIEEL